MCDFFGVHDGSVVIYFGGFQERVSHPPGDTKEMDCLLTLGVAGSGCKARSFCLSYLISDEAKIQKRAK